jgi:uridylate kinase
MENTKVISVGGSLIAPDGVDASFLKNFTGLVRRYLEEDGRRRLILVCGGGSLARQYQKAYRAVADDPTDENADWVGIQATRLNGELMRRLLVPYCVEPLVTDPEAVSLFYGRVLVAAGWKPGFSTDYDAVLLAKKFFADTVLNPTDVPRVYSADPRKDPQAMPFDRMSWEAFKGVIGGEWKPGTNAPFDPVAARQAARDHLKVVVCLGSDLANLERILRDESFVGTTIGPD